MGTIVGAYGVSHTGMMIRKYAAGTPAHERVCAAFARVRDEIAALAPDAIVVAGSDHLQGLTYDCFPQACVGIGDHATGLGDAGVPARQVPLADPLAEEVLHRAVGAGIDLAFAVNPHLDHGFMAPLTFIDPSGAIPVVPVPQNAATPPLTPMSRSVALGAALREAIDARPQDERVVLLATGGLSHWVATPRMGEINEEFDRWFLEQVR